MQNGKPRQLHLKQSIDCIEAPHVDYKQERIVNNYPGMSSERLVKCPFYTLERWEIDGKYSFENDKPFINASVIDGSGMINGQKIGKGEHFIIPATLKQCNIEGKLTVMISYC